jgi:flagellar hook-associated protein 1
MPGLYSRLDAAVTALNAQSIAINTAGKNLANVNNPNYARERVVFGQLGTVQTASGPESMGLTALGVEQLRSALLDGQVRNENALSSYYQTLQNAYQQAQAGLGQTVSSTDASGATATTDSGVGAALDGLFNAFQSFAANPTDSGQRQALLQSASILTDRLQSTDQNLAQVQDGLDTQIGSDVADVNTLLGQIANLNAQIARFEVNHPGSAVDLRDQREADLEQLAAKLPVTVSEDPSGQDKISVKDASGNPVVLVSLGSVTGPVSFNGTQVSGGTPATVLSPNSGSIQGAITARDGGIQTLRDSLDQLAKQLVTSVNAVYNPAGNTGDFFNSAGTTAGTISLAAGVTAASLKASDGGAAGDNTVALGVAQLANHLFSTGGGDQINGTFSGFYANSVSGFGQTLAGTNAQVKDQSNILNLVTTQRDAVSGVSLDEDMANLLKYQRSFQASSQVFQTIDTLIDTVVNRLGSLGN